MGAAGFKYSWRKMEAAAQGRTDLNLSPGLIDGWHNATREYTRSKNRVELVS